MALYRLRWQIELLFKRLKSLLHLDTLPSRQGPTAKSWMLARLIAAALAQRLVQPSGPLSPWGYELRSEPVDPWSRFRMTLWALRGAILGKGPWLLIHSEKHLDRLRNTPRKRNLTSHELGEGIQEMSQLSLF